MAAHSSPLVRFLLMDDKGGVDEIKALRSCVCVCVCVCAVMRIVVMCMDHLVSSRYYHV